MWRRWMRGAALLVLLGSAACTEDATRSTPEPSKPAPPQDDGLFHPALSIQTPGALDGTFDLPGAAARVRWAFYSPITSLTVEVTGPATRSIAAVADGSPPGTDPDEHTTGCELQRLAPGQYKTRVSTVGTGTWQVDISVLNADVVRVPDVRGEKSHTVAQELAEHGLEADVRPRCDLTAETEDGVEERGEIIAVDRVGEVVPLDTRITVHWLDFRILGSAVGQEVQRAREELEASGYEVQVSGRGSTVLSQSPDPDAAVCPKSTVRLQT